VASRRDPEEPLHHSSDPVRYREPPCPAASGACRGEARTVRPGRPARREMLDMMGAKSFCMFVCICICSVRLQRADSRSRP